MRIQSVRQSGAAHGNGKWPEWRSVGLIVCLSAAVRKLRAEVEPLFAPEGQKMDAHFGRRS